MVVAFFINHLFLTTSASYNIKLASVSPLFLNFGTVSVVLNCSLLAEKKNSFNFFYNPYKFSVSTIGIVFLSSLL